jgi:SAM-dependent methyltransferase
MNGRLHPSAWVQRFAALVPHDARVLDLACGSGRHARFFAARGCSVEAVDRDEAALAELEGVPGVRTRAADLEGGAWPYASEHFGAVVVANYLHRPLFGPIAAVLEEGGVLVYETFMQGNEQLRRPSNPAFLLEPHELLRAFADLWLVAFEQGRIEVPQAAVVQRLCAVKGAGPILLADALLEGRPP